MNKKCLLALLVLSLGCAEATFNKGMTAFQQEHWQSSIQILEPFVQDHCASAPRNGHCHEAYVTLAEANLSLGKAKDAFMGVAKARWDETVTPELTQQLNHLEQAAHEVISKTLRRDPGTGHFAVDFSSRTNGRMRFRKLTLAMDFVPLHGEDGHADDVTASIVIPSSTIPAGQHVLEVIAWYEGAGVIRPGYRFTTGREQTLTVWDGQSLDIRVRIKERPDWTEWPDALDLAIDVGAR